MKKYENNFAVTGYVAKDAEVINSLTQVLHRFPLAVARQEKIGEETKRISAFMNMKRGARMKIPGRLTSLPRYAADRRRLLQA